MTLPAPPVWTSNDRIMRPAETADRAELVRLFVESYEHYWETPDKALPHSTATVEALLSGTSGCRLGVAVQSDSLVGFCTYTLLHPAPSPEGTLFLKDLYVSAALRGSSLGKDMMIWMDRFAESLGCTRFDWTAETTNPRAVGFYDRLGARRVTEKVYLRTTPGQDMV